MTLPWVLLSNAAAWPCDQSSARCTYEAVSKVGPPELAMRLDLWCPAAHSHRGGNIRGEPARGAHAAGEETGGDGAGHCVARRPRPHARRRARPCAGAAGHPVCTPQSLAPQVAAMWSWGVAVWGCHRGVAAMHRSSVGRKVQSPSTAVACCCLGCSPLWRSAPCYAHPVPARQSWRQVQEGLLCQQLELDWALPAFVFGIRRQMIQQRKWYCELPAAGAAADPGGVLGAVPGAARGAHLPGQRPRPPRDVHLPDVHRDDEQRHPGRLPGPVH
jgi:hypothetical protein